MANLGVLSSFRDAVAQAKGPPALSRSCPERAEGRSLPKPMTKAGEAGSQSSFLDGLLAPAPEAPGGTSPRIAIRRPRPRLVPPGPPWFRGAAPVKSRAW